MGKTIKTCITLEKEKEFEYRGSVLTSFGVLEFKIKSTVHMGSLANHGPENIEELREIFQIIIDKDDEIVQLSNDEYSVLFQLLYPAALSFYNSPLDHGDTTGFSKSFLEWLNDGGAVGSFSGMDIEWSQTLEDTLRKYQRKEVVTEEKNHSEEIPF